jgi:hypothetical protein
MKNFLLLFCLFFSFPSLAKLTTSGFLGIPWGSSKELVHQIYPDIKPIDTLNNALFLKIIKDSRQHVFVFEFKENKLYRVTSASESLGNTPLDTAKFCDKTAKNLAAITGEPDKIVQDKDLGPVLFWFNEDTLLQLSCKLDNPGAVMFKFEEIKSSKKDKTL